MSLCRQSLLCRNACLSAGLVAIVGFMAFAEVPVLGPLSAAEMQRRLVDSDWLLREKDKPDLVILDTRTRDRYEKNHIEGAVSLPVWDTFGSDPRSDLVAPISKIQNLFGAAGVDQETRVILYDDGEMIDAARVFWILETHGQQRVAILNPGYKAWQARGLSVSTRATHPPKRAFLSHITPNRLATKFSTRLAIDDPDVVIIDARHADEYEGKTSKAARKGHIPKAISVPSEVNLRAPEAGLKSFAALEKIYAGIDKHKKVITYCNKGRDSALTYFILRQLGYDVAAYDGSWFEWGNDPQLPVEMDGTTPAYR